MVAGARVAGVQLRRHGPRREHGRARAREHGRREQRRAGDDDDRPGADDRRADDRRLGRRDDDLRQQQRGRRDHELDDRGVLRNSAFIVGSDGTRAAYRKVHLWYDENDLFVPGDQPPLVVDTEVGRIGLCICYEMEFPEWIRTAALQGIDILCTPTNWPTSPRPPGERPIEVTRAQASASVDRIFVAVCDRVGAERGTEWVGGSTIVGPDGYVLAMASFDESGKEGGEQILVVECDLADARRKATSPRNGVVADRRPELYGAVTRPVTHPVQ